MPTRFGSLMSGLAILVWLAVPTLSSAQQVPFALPAAASEARVYPLEVRPAAEYRPALKLRLLPSAIDQRPGNAALIYTKTALSLPVAGGLAAAAEQWQAWMEMPLDQLPLDEVRLEVADWQRVLDDLDLAARREGCDWELPIRERSYIALLIPEVQQMRTLAVLLAVQIRLHLADGDYPAALRSLQTGYAMARHTAQGATLIHGLVGMAITNTLHRQLEDFVQQPGAPNLYWALAMLPQPLIDLRPGLESEWCLIYLSFPELLELDAPGQGPEHWRRLVDEMIGKLPLMSDQGGALPELGVKLTLTLGYTRAKQALIEQGRSLEEVEAMPVGQVIVIYTLETYEQLRDDVFKWHFAPWDVAAMDLEEAIRDLQGESRQREIIPLARLLGPGVQVAAAQRRVDRDVAMLQTVEALRMYAANHGRLPARLDEIREAPAPRDPLLLQPFAYRQQDQTVVLESIPPATARLRVRDFGQRYEIRLVD